MKKLKPKTLLGVPMNVEFEIGRTIKTVEELLQIKRGQVVTLDNSILNAIQLNVNGVPFARGIAMRQIKQSHLYTKIDEILKKN